MGANDFNTEKIFEDAAKMMSGLTGAMDAAMGKFPKQAPKNTKLNGKECSVCITKMNHIIVEFRNPEDAQAFFDSINKTKKK